MAATVRPPPRYAITSEAGKLASRVIYVGGAGIGKTSFAAQTPNPVFIMSRGETGLLTLIDVGSVSPTPHFPEATTWLETLGMLDHLLLNDHDRRTLVIDTINGIERLCFEHCVQTQFGGSWHKFADYGKGVERALEQWNVFVGLLHKLNTQKRMSVVLLSHCRVKKFANPLGEDFDRFHPDLHEKTWAVVNRWADAVLFGSTEIYVQKETGKAKATSSGVRVLYTREHACYEAKNRFGLPNEIMLGGSAAEGWANFLAAMRAARAANLPKTNGALSDSDRVLATAVVEVLDQSSITKQESQE